MRLAVAEQFRARGEPPFGTRFHLTPRLVANAGVETITFSAHAGTTRAAIILTGMEGFVRSTQRERLRAIAAILRRIYSPEPCSVPEAHKALMRRIKELSEPNSREASEPDA